MRKVILAAVLVIGLTSIAFGATTNRTETLSQGAWTGLSISNYLGNNCGGTVTWSVVSIDTPQSITNIQVTVLSNHLLVKPDKEKGYVTLVYKWSATANRTIVSTNDSHAWSSTTLSTNTVTFNPNGGKTFLVAITNATLTEFSVDINQ